VRVDGVEMKLDIVRHERPRGGSQAYWCCPTCGREVWHLYIRTEGLVCRKCAGLDYWSRQTCRGAEPRAQSAPQARCPAWSAVASAAAAAALAAGLLGSDGGSRVRDTARISRSHCRSAPSRLWPIPGHGRPRSVCSSSSLRPRGDRLLGVTISAGGWVQVLLSTVLGDFSRYILAWKLCTTMSATDVSDTLLAALGVRFEPGQGFASATAVE